MRASTRKALSALLAAAALGATAGASPEAARADHVQGARSNKLVERAHWISLRMGRGHADLVVRRTVQNVGPRHDQAEIWIDLPDEAVATGLRSLGMKDGRPIWFEAELMEAEAAAAKYRALPGAVADDPRDPALLSWRNSGLLALQVSPVPPAQTRTVEYTLQMPAHYHDGRYHVALPKMGSSRLDAQVTVTAANEEDGLFVGDKPVRPGAGFKLDREELSVALSRRAPGTIEGGLASVTFAGDRVLSHFHVEAAARLSEVPRGAYVVVVLDASRSIARADAAAGVAAVRAALSHFKDARVEILTFDREVRALHGGFVPVGKAIADLGKLTLEPRNGSRIDEALTRADALLGALPARVPKRILAVTDLNTRSSLTPERAKRLVQSGAILHLGVVRHGTPSLVPDDDHPWATIARATGGLLWAAAAAPDEAQASVYEEWARPVRLHKLELAALGIDDGALSIPATLDEGQGLEDLRINPRPVRAVTVEGELWGRRVRRVFEPEEDEGRRWSALAFGAPEILDSLGDDERMVLAQRGHAVSPVTSLLAIASGERPFEGPPWEGEGFGKGMGIGLGSIGTTSHCVGFDPSFDPQRFLHDALARGLDACGGSGRKATVVLETTLAEVVDVPSVDLEGASDPKLRHCLEEAAWDLLLPGRFDASWQSWTVDV